MTKHRPKRRPPHWTVQALVGLVKARGTTLHTASKLSALSPTTTAYWVNHGNMPAVDSLEKALEPFKMELALCCTQTGRILRKDKLEAFLAAIDEDAA